jgi:hypothetical protein
MFTIEIAFLGHLYQHVLRCSPRQKDVVERKLSRIERKLIAPMAVRMDGKLVSLLVEKMAALSRAAYMSREFRDTCQQQAHDNMRTACWDHV